VNRLVRLYRVADIADDDRLAIRHAAYSKR
jgi:hypothetical protein